MFKHKLYIIFHKYIIDECYKTNIKFDDIIFLKCNELFEAKYNKKKNYNIIYEKDFKIYNPKLQDLSKPYMAVSALYHIFKNKTYLNLDYIGFLEYDLSFEIDPVLIKNNLSNNEIQNLKSINNIYEEIHKYMSNNKRLIILLSARHRFKSFYEENIKINNINIFNIIIDDYNKYFKTNFTLEYILNENPVLGDQQSFISDLKTFELLMGFITYLIENKKVEIKNIRPSFLLARYIGVSLFFIDVPTKLLSLKHLNKHEW